MSKADIVRDAAGGAGCFLISYGSWLVFEPAGYIVAGLLAVTISILGGRH